MNRNIIKLIMFMLILVVAVAGCGQKDTEEKTEMTTINIISLMIFLFTHLP
ncbi:hypothetical protein V327_02596, partial [Staphylococcus aureus F29450_091412]